MQWYYSLKNTTASYQTVSSWGNFDVLEAALYRSSSVMIALGKKELSPFELISYLRSSQVRTPFGTVTYDANGINTAAKALAVQALPSSTTAEIIAPSEVNTADFVYPMPTWEERVYKWELIGRKEEKISIIIAAICTALLLTMLVTVCVHRRGMNSTSISLPTV